MMNNELITLAATEYENALLSALSEREWEPHDFSPKFEGKMEKLCRKVHRRPTFTTLKRVAIIALISALLAGSLALTNPTVRAAVIDWVKEYIKGAYTFLPQDNHHEIFWDFELSWIPYGYKLSETNENSAGRTLVYKSNFKTDITFTYMNTFNIGADYIFTDPAIVKNVTVNGLSAEIYIFPASKKPNAIICSTQDKNIQFLITADADEETLIKLAESIVLTKDNTHKNPTLPPAAE